jgi:hypothetical protein
MSPVTCSHPLMGRRWGLRVATIAFVLLLFALSAGGPVWGNGAKAPHNVIFDPAAEASWTLEYHGPGDSPDGAMDVAMAANGVTYIAGGIGNATGDIDTSLLKLVDGVPAWPAPKTYDNPDPGFDGAMKMALGPGNTIYTAGMCTGTNGLVDILVLKWSANGAVQWARRYDGPGHGHDQVTAVGVDAAGNVTVSGASLSATTVDWVVVSWSASGARRWTSRYAAGPGQQIVPLDLVVAADGSIYATGRTSATSSEQALTVRYSAAGKTLWKKTYAGPEGLGASTRSMVARPGGGVYVCGNTTSAATGLDGLVMSYTPKGMRDVFALDTGPGGASEQRLKDLTVTSTGQVVAAGSSTSAGNSDCHAVTYSTDGTIAGKLTWPGAWYDEFVAVASDAFGGFYVTGTYRTAVDKAALLTQRGSVLNNGGGWSSLWAPTFVSVNNSAEAIAVRGSTAIVVGRCMNGVAQGDDQLMLGFVY